MEVTGTVIKVGSPYTVGQNNYKKCDLILQTAEQYPQKLLIEFSGDKGIAALVGVTENQNVEVGVNLRGREWTDKKGATKYFNTIQGWRVKVIENTTQPELVTESEGEDLPF